MSAPRGPRGRGGGRERSRGGRSRDTSQTRGASQNNFDKRATNPFSSAPRGAKSTLNQNGTPRGSAMRGKSSFAAIGGFSTTNPMTMKDQSWRSIENADGANYKEKVIELWKQLKVSRENERKDAIRSGFLADPDKPRSLKDAITPVGTCQDMCPEFERIERIVQSVVDGCERTTIESGARVPCEDIMVKRFRRSAAGNEEQIPSDIRPPLVLQKTLNYLLDEVVGGPEPLANVHKFVWDRTRAIRNDFSIQQVSKTADLKVAIDCFERIARFHLLSLHQLSHPDRDNGEFDHHQEREQLNNTLLSLMYYYDDSRHKLSSPNEAEFRAYCIIFEMQDQRPDLEDRAQNWPIHILRDPQVKTALKLYSAAGSTLDEQGPIRPRASFSIAQGNYGRFWSIIKSSAVSYLMACAAEIYFNLVRANALEVIHKAYKQGPSRTIEDLSLDDLTNSFGFDNEEQTETFLEEHGFVIKERDDGVAYLVLNSVAGGRIRDSNASRKQVFSKSLVESKRFGRPLQAVINGLTVSQCRKDGLIEDMFSSDEEETLFIAPAEPEESNPPPGPNGVVNGDIPSSQPPPDSKPSNPFAPSSGPTTNPFQAAAAAKQMNANTNGTSTSSFGQPSMGSFGQSSTGQASVGGFGQSSTGGLGQSSTGGFGQSSLGVFGQPSTGGFGKPSLPSSGFRAPSTTAGEADSTANAATTNSMPSPKKPFASFGSSSFPTTSPFSSNQSAKSIFDSPEPPKKQPLFKFGQPAANDAPQPADQNPSAQTNSSQTNEPEQNILHPITTLPTSTSSGPTSSTTQPVETIDLSKNSTKNLPNSKPIPEIATSAPNESRDPTFPDFKVPRAPPHPTVPNAPDSAKIPSQPTFHMPKGFSKDAPSLAVPTAPTQIATSPTPKPTQNHQQPSIEDGSDPPPEPKQNHQKTHVDEGTEPSGHHVGPEVMDSLAAEVVLGDRGILEQFLEYTMADIALQAVRDVRVEKERERVAKARRIFLEIKYFKKWKKIAWEMNLRRRGARKRQRFAETRREMMESARNGMGANNGTNASFASSAQGPLIDPIASMPGGSDSLRISSSPLHSGNLLPAKPTTKSLKRKSLPAELQEADYLSLDDNGSSTTKTTSPTKRTKSAHKRSHTLGGSNYSTQDGLGESIYFAQSGRVAKPGSSKNGITKSLLGVRSLVDPKLMAQARLLVKGKTDTTRTDYFKLKARGIDPDTPVVPKTRKRSRVSDPADDAEATPSKRPSPDRSFASPNLRPSQLSASASSGGSRRSGTYTPRYDPEEEQMYEQSRKLRQFWAEDQAWMREVREQMEKQRRSDESQRRGAEPRHTSSRTSVRPQSTGAAALWERTKEIRQRKQAEKERNAAAAKGLGGVTEQPLSNGPTTAGIHNGVAYMSGAGTSARERSGASADDAIEL